MKYKKPWHTNLLTPNEWELDNASDLSPVGRWVYLHNPARVGHRVLGNVRERWHDRKNAESPY